MTVTIHNLERLPISSSNTEYVERKGIGHPDSLIDGIVDSISRELSKQYMEKYGIILHHNVDKGLIIGGASEVGFGTGKITRKIEVIVTGKATDNLDGKKIDVNKIATETTSKYLKENTRFLDVDNEVTIIPKLYKGSVDLSALFMRGNGVPLANDTSFGVGFAPFTDAEKLVLEAENYLNSKEYKKKMPMVGEDIKVMGLREANRITLTIAIAFVSKFINSIEEYVKFKEEVKEDVKRHVKGLTEKEVDVEVNTGDSIERNEVYLTKSGLSCESGDDGSVGRGNRVNGLITPFRQMSLEAAAGKNPVSHVGKIYNMMANEIAKDIAKNNEGIKECEVEIMSQIGRRIDDPKNLNINLILEKGTDFEKAKKDAEGIARDWLSKTAFLTTEIVLGKYKVF